MPRSGQHIIDTEPEETLADSLTKKLKELSPLSGECCIFKVPEPLRRQNKKAFTPQVVSIGPIHCVDKNLKAMEEHKIRFLKDFLEISNISVEECINLIEKNETKLRNCYAETIEPQGKEFVRIMLLDATFVIMVLLCSRFPVRNFLTSKEDRLFGKPQMMQAIRYDMLMLENQVPFFILEDIFKLSKTKKFLKRHFNPSIEPEYLCEELAMIRLAHDFIGRRINSGMEIAMKKNDSFKVDHLLDYLRIYYTSEWKPEEKKLDKTLDTPSVKELHQAGIKFEVKSKKNIFDIDFKDGKLKIPQLIIDESSTEILFRNLLAFEKCRCLDHPFADYIAIMGQLIKTPKDVQLLIKEKIIDNWYSGKGLSALFHSLNTENVICPSKFYYSDLVKNLNEYYGFPCNEWKATLKQKYFKNPWTIISVLAAIVLLILTIIQTVCSILQVK